MDFYPLRMGEFLDMGLSFVVILVFIKLILGNRDLS